MRRFLSWLTGRREPQPKQSAPQPDTAATGPTRFALDLYMELKDYVGPYENVVCAPFAVSLALASIHAGARGRTADQLEHVLACAAAEGPWQSALTGLRARLTAVAEKEGFVLGLAHGLWAPAGLPLLKTFRKAVEQSYGAAVTQADFSQEEPARTLINQWLREATRQLLDTVVARGELTPEARLVLIAALCFKGYWATPFDAQQTLDEPFWVNPHAKIVAPMMWQHARFAYGQFPFHFADRLQVLELPFAGKELSLVLLLPEGIEGIIELEHTLGRQKGKLPAWLGELQRREIEVVLPKFAFASRFNMGETLGELGPVDAFSPQDADFTGMRSERDVSLSHVFHQVLVAIDEYGADFAPAAGDGSGTARPDRATPRPVPMFRADHPFLFLIRDRVSGQIVFMGRVMNPGVAPKLNFVL